MESYLAQKIKKTLLGVGLALLFFSAHTATAQAATLYFSPSSGSHTTGNTLSTSIYVNTQEVAVNNADAVISFPTNLLEVVSVSKSGSIFSLWVEEPAFSNSSGTISFNGGLPTPGYNGSAGKIINVVFKIKEAGSASLTCSSAAVRANDGLGTDVLQACGQARFTLTAPETPPPQETPAAPETPEPSPETPVTSVPAAPVVTSSTHPDPVLWYSNNNPVFSWALPASVTGVNVLADRNATQDPGTRSDGRFASYDYSDVDEGNWYFHIRLQNANGWGPVTHFAFNIDHTAPTLPVVRLVEQPTADNAQGLIAFESTDALSGIAYHEIKIEGEQQIIDTFDWDLADGDCRLPQLPPGEYTISVTTYDHAGNASVAGTLAYVAPAVTSPIVETPASVSAAVTLGPWAVNPWINFWGMVILLASILTLTGLCIWLWRTGGSYRVDNMKTRATVRMMQRTIKDFEKQLNDFERKHAKSQTTSEKIAPKKVTRRRKVEK